MVDISKAYGYDEKAVEQGVEFYFGDAGESILQIRHLSSRSVQDVVKSFTKLEQHLWERGNFENEKYRDLLSRVLVASIASVTGEPFEFNGKKLAQSPGAFTPVFKDKRALPFTEEILRYASEKAYYGGGNFEEDSKNS